MAYYDGLKTSDTEEEKNIVLTQQVIYFYYMIVKFEASI